jgi:hypothetical protein
LRDSKGQLIPVDLLSVDLDGNEFKEYLIDYKSVSAKITSFDFTNVTEIMLSPDLLSGNAYMGNLYLKEIKVIK